MKIFVAKCACDTCTILVCSRAVAYATPCTQTQELPRKYAQVPAVWPRLVLHDPEVYAAAGFCGYACCDDNAPRHRGPRDPNLIIQP